ncbi:MAG: pilus assembly protein PilM [Patescibacteria group bacterium]|nr:pilus assembly protein PilM [Patescibacteria group bacterium]
MLFGFQKKQAFGLDVSDTSIEALILKRKGSKIEIESYGHKELPSAQLVENGLIKEKNELAKNIREVLDQAKPRPIKEKFCLLSLPSSQVFTYLFQLPANLTQKELSEALIYEAEQVFPLSTSQLYTDFQIIGKINKIQQVFFAGCRKELIDDWQETLKIAHLTPIVFDLEPLSLRRALIKEIPKDEGILIIDIGQRTSVFSLFDERGLVFNHYLRVAGNLFTKKVSEALGLSFEEAEKIKVAEGFRPQKYPKVEQVLKKEALPIIDEARRILIFYQQTTYHQVKKIILAGGSSLLPGISAYFQKKLGLETTRGEPLTNIKGDFLAQEEKRILSANVIGLALRALEKDFQKVEINLLKK